MGRWMLHAAICAASSGTAGGTLARSALRSCVTLRVTSPCGARSSGPPGNSLRSLRSLCSDNPGEFEDEARCARGQPPCAPRALRHERSSPPPAVPELAEPAALRGGRVPVAVQQGCGWAPPAAHGEAPRSTGLAARARSALRELTRRDCSSTANAGSGASSAAGLQVRAPQGSEPGRKTVPADGLAPASASRPASRLAWRDSATHRLPLRSRRSPTAALPRRCLRAVKQGLQSPQPGTRT